MYTTVYPPITNKQSIKANETEFQSYQNLYVCIADAPRHWRCFQTFIKIKISMNIKYGLDGHFDVSAESEWIDDIWWVWLHSESFDILLWNRKMRPINVVTHSRWAQIYEKNKERKKNVMNKLTSSHGIGNMYHYDSLHGNGNKNTNRTNENIWFWL